MIVSCPGCQTRYRHLPDPQALAVSGRCGACDSRFPLEEARKPYVLLPGSLPARGVRPRGMDDSTLADKLGLSVPVAERDQAAPVFPHPAGEAEAAAPAFDAGLLPREETGPASVPGRSGLTYVLGTLAGTAAGAGLAYYVARQGGTDEIAWTAIGGAIGLLLGWSCLLWTRPRK